ncbi:diaminopropionate ammonia-lyase [Bradyrhizobium sp. NP1]|uniref:diaminopropionate ammonia-lyase n=1 Tax=Bradyrhizobium sp. NP1 TaxID=3049772 RepID=UPI0025A502E4|nr:diaminopropionate ammonia-lyase [Bradyrhizobium sp. NP1]WJR77885.1 diaminopropionate ammonia-lyase [Bradyrhizobium sp. NP1]
MFLLNKDPSHDQALDPTDAATLSVEAAREAERFLKFRKNHQPTPLKAMPALARDLGVAAVHIKDEGHRLGLGSFKALGGSYAVIKLTLEEASRALGRTVDISEIETPEVRKIARGLTFGCATDGNHGRSVAAGAQIVGAKAVIFVHAGVSEERVAAIEHFGAETVRVDGTYDDSVAVAERVCKDNNWVVVSDTSWPGYERIPGLVMQGYTAMLNEILRDLREPPTHVLIQAGVGGLAAAAAGFFDIVYGKKRPKFVVVEPDRADCLYQSAVAGKPIKIAHQEPTIMAMLECYEPSLVAWRILSRKADGFLTVGENDAADAMRRLAHPAAGDPAIVAGESGCAGLAGLCAVAADHSLRQAIGLDANARVLLINTEGATDRKRYEAIVGAKPESILADA